MSYDSANLRILKSHQTSFLNHFTVRNQYREGKTVKTHERLEAKRYVTRQPKDQWRNQSNEKKKYLETNNSEKQNDSNLRDTAKVILRGKFIATPPYLRKQTTTTKKCK